MTSEPRRLLLVTPLDLDQHPNNLEQNRVRAYARRGFELTVVDQAWNRSKRRRDLVRDALSWRVRTKPLPAGVDAPGATRLQVDPLLNVFGGLRRDAEERAPTRRGPARRLLVVASQFTILRPLSFVLCATLTVLLRAKRRHDLALGMGPWGGAVAWLLRAVGRVRVLVYVDRDDEAALVPRWSWRFVTSRVERFVARRADVRVSVGHALAARRERETGCSFLVVPSGVDWHRFAPAREERDEPGGATLLHVGNLTSWSGLALVVRALPRLAERHPTVRLRVVGDGLPGFTESLERLAHELGVVDRLELLGPRPPEELPALLAEADVALAVAEPVPFRRYASPLKVVEAMAAGVPVVTTEGTEAADLVLRSGATGAGVAVAYDVDAIGAALDRLLADPERRRQLGRAGREASRELDWDVLVDRELVHVEAACERATSSAPRGSSQRTEVAG